MLADGDLVGRGIQQIVQADVHMLDRFLSQVRLFGILARAFCPLGVLVLLPLPSHPRSLDIWALAVFSDDALQAQS